MTPGGSEPSLFIAATAALMRGTTSLVCCVRPITTIDADHVVLVIAAGDAEPRHEADVDARHVLDQHRHAVVLAEHDVLDILDVIALRQIVVAAVVDQPDAADVDRLLADRDLAPADVDVGVAERARAAAAR